MKHIFILLVVMIGQLSPSQAQPQKDFNTQKKLALIIGNKEYQFASSLKNTINDAQDMSLTLNELGFETMLYTNLDYVHFLKAIDTFAQKSPEYDVLLFYFSGHGMMFSGDNFLVPVDASLRNNEQQIEIECINVKRIMANFNNGEGKANIAIIDACRNKPFNRNWVSNSRDLSNGNRLNLTNFRASGSIVALASGEGETSSDNPKGRNGLFTSSLIKFMKEPGLTVNEVLQLTRKEVKSKSNSTQNPIEFNELVGNFYFIQDKQTQKKTKEKKVVSKIIDTDEDGIVDSKDKCPFEKGEIEDRGCPKRNDVGKTKKNKIDIQSEVVIEEKPVQSVNKINAKQKNIRLQEGTTIRLVLKEELSSKKAAIGDPVELEVNEDVVVDGYVVIKAGTPVKAEIADVSKAKMLGKQGKIDIVANFTTSVDNQSIRIRTSKKIEGKNNTANVAVAAYLIAPAALFIKGKEAKLPKGSLFNGYIDNTYMISGFSQY
jgi:Caspase domain